MDQMKATAEAGSNLAPVKYMGKRKPLGSEDENLAENDNLSVTLDAMTSTTTVQFSDQYPEDIVIINGEQEPGEYGKVPAHLDRIRAKAGIALRAKVVSQNNFPTGTGLSSSASGFAALTVAAAAAAGLALSERELSILARRGSGSASRSVPGGFVRWRAGETSAESYAETVFPADHWAIADVVAVVSTARKELSTTMTHAKVTETPYYAARMQSVAGKADRCQALIGERDFQGFGELMEREALELHAVFLAAGILHLHGPAVDLMRQVPRWRQEGLGVYYSVNTGQDVHLICMQKDTDAVQERLASVGVERTIVNKPGRGARLVDTHLF